MPMSNFPGRFVDGVSIGNVPIEITAPNRVFWVCNSTVASTLGGTTTATGVGIGKGSDSNPGTFQLPLATLSKAVTLAKIAGSNTSEKGDLIIIAPNHAETLTAATAISVTGLKVLCLGTEGDRPTFTLATNATANISLTGADTALVNAVIIDNVGATVAVKLAATGAMLQGCTIKDGSASFTTGVSVVGGGSNAADRAKVIGCYIRSAGATNGILLGEVDDQVEIMDNTILGAYSTAAIQNPTSTVLTNLRLERNKIANTSAGGIGINMVSACTGYSVDNKISVTGSATPLVAGSLQVPSPIDSTAPITLVGSIKALPQTTTATAFTVTGGLVRVLFMGSEVTTAIQNQVNNTKFTFTDTISSTATDLCAAASVANAAVGTYLWVKGDAVATAMQVTAGGLAVGGAANGIILSPGTVVMNCAASNTGNIKHRVTYVPITPGASITMA